MYVDITHKCINHILVSRYVSYYAKFNLRIVGTHEHTARVGYKRAPYLASVVGTDRYIL